MKTSKTNRFETETKAWARRMIARTIAEAYENFALAKARKLRISEPALTVAALTDYLDQCGRPDDYRFSPRRWRSALVRNTCESLCKAGELDSSTGCGERDGTEAKCYEPTGF